MNELEILRRGRDRVAAGWLQGEWDAVFHDGPCYCAADTLGYESGNGTDQPEVEKALFALYRHGVLGSPEGHVELSGDVLDEVTLWNDQKERTQDEVVAAFDRTIEALS